MTNEQKQKIIELLWDHLLLVRGDDSKRQTGWGIKTQEGLVASIETIMSGSYYPPTE